MQGTVRTFDPRTGSGSVFLGDGSVAAFSGAAFAASGLRLLRPGQRVTLWPGDGGEIRALSLVTLPPTGLPGPGGSPPEPASPPPGPLEPAGPPPEPANPGPGSETPPTGQAGGVSPGTEIT